MKSSSFDAVWIFEINEESGDYFNGNASWLPIEVEHCEAI